MHHLVKKELETKSDRKLLYHLSWISGPEWHQGWHQHHFDRSLNVPCMRSVNAVWLIIWCKLYMVTLLKVHPVGGVIYILYFSLLLLLVFFWLWLRVVLIIEILLCLHVIEWAYVSVQSICLSNTHWVGGWWWCM